MHKQLHSACVFLEQSVPQRNQDGHVSTPLWVSGELALTRGSCEGLSLVLYLDVSSRNTSSPFVITSASTHCGTVRIAFPWSAAHSLFLVCECRGSVVSTCASAFQPILGKWPHKQKRCWSTVISVSFFLLLPEGNKCHIHTCWLVKAWVTPGWVRPLCICIKLTPAHVTTHNAYRCWETYV